MFMVKRLIRNRLLYLAMVFLVISLIIVIFNYPVSAQSGCSVTRGKDGTATSFYNVSASCFIDYGWVAPVPHTAGNLRTSASYDYDSPIYLKNWGFRHAAVDLIGSESDPYDNNKTVRAIGPGIVKHINRLPTTYPPAYHPHPRNDSLIVIEHTATNGNKFLAYYGHAYAATNLSHLPPNNTVNKNQPIGTLVQSGSPTHLHFEINTTLDPPDWRYGPIDKFTSTPPRDRTGVQNPMQYLMNNPGSPSTTYYTLTVNSTNPTSGVAISSSTGHGGRTLYRRTLAPGTRVTLTALLHVGSGANRKTFDRWSGASTSTNRTITLRMNGNRAVTANYVNDPVTSLPPRVTLRSPANNATIAGTAITLRWNAARGASKYQVQIRRANNTVFKNRTLGNVLQLRQAGFPNNGSSFKWRVRAGNESNWGQWSVYRTFYNIRSVSNEDWEKVGNLPSHISIHSVTWGNNRYVAVGSFGHIYSSSNGLSWVAQTSGTDRTLYGVTWNDNQFVAVGLGGTILTSQDGTVWIEQSSSTNIAFEDVTWGNNRFVAVGWHGYIDTSTNGVTWNRQVSGTERELKSVAYSGSQFVAVGASGTIISSQNGLNWDSQISGTTQWLRGVAWGNNSFVAVGSNGVLLTSPNGINWTARNSGVTQSLCGVTWGNNRFVAVGGGGAIITSTDGSNWSSQDSGTRNWLYDINWNGSKFMAVGSGGTILVSPPR